MKRTDVLLRPLIRDLGLDEGIRLAQIKFQWHNLFRKPLSHHMSPSTLSGNELLLNVDSPVWLQELKFYQEEIIKKLAPYHVRTVRFRLGRINAIANQRAEKEGPKSEPLTVDDRAFIEETVSDIEDETLKKVIEKAITKAMKAGRAK